MNNLQEIDLFHEKIITITNDTHRKHNEQHMMIAKTKSNKMHALQPMEVGKIDITRKILHATDSYANT